VLPIARLRFCTALVRNHARSRLLSKKRMICRIVQRMLSDVQYKVQLSQSVADAVKALEKKPFDVYVLDYKLPDSRIKSEFPTVED
jgi:DNA-binding NtrC family response regulator